jgi:hypothetical protein
LVGAEWIPEVEYLDDDFETGDFSQWNGTRVSSGEKIGVSPYRSLFGAYGGRATSNGREDVEYAYCYKRLSCSELYARGAFYVATSGIVDEGQHFYLMTFQEGTNILAGVGWRKVEGALRWFLLIRDGQNSIINYSAVSPVSNHYYSIELYWKKDAVNGEGQLWATDSWYFGGIDGDTDQICSITGKNTAEHGDISEVRVGLPTVSYCRSTVVYFDKVKMSNYFMETPWGIGFGQDLLTDGFETRSFERWSGTTAYKGGTARVTSASPHSGQYSVRFSSGTTLSTLGQAYCYKNVHLPEDIVGNSVLVRFCGFFKVTRCNIPVSDGRIYLFRAWDGNVEIVGAGWEKIDGVYRWFLSRKDGDITITAYSESTPSLNEWYFVDIEWCPFEYMWGVTGCRMWIANDDWSFDEHIMEIGVNPIVYDTITRVDVGVAKTVNCGSVTVYGDDFDFNARQWE